MRLEVSVATSKIQTACKDNKVSTKNNAPATAVKAGIYTGLALLHCYCLMQYQLLRRGATCEDHAL